jgi:hypothetical protein
MCITLQLIYKSAVGGDHTEPQTVSSHEKSELMCYTRIQPEPTTGTILWDKNEPYTLSMFPNTG